MSTTNCSKYKYKTYSTGLVLGGFPVEPSGNYILIAQYVAGAFVHERGALAADTARALR